MNKLNCTPIGKIITHHDLPAIQIFSPYLSALYGLTGFSHILVFWWFHASDTDKARRCLTVESPYTQGPEILGTFATRSPKRPTPIALTTAAIIKIQPEDGIITLNYFDALEGSPVIDIKPYTPSLDRVEQPIVPAWCGHWPKSLESSAAFDWQKEFHF